MKNTRALCQTAVVAALYVALTTLNPLSWGAIQFRVANMLCALPFKDKRYAPAVLLGIAIGKLLSSLCPWLCSSEWSCTQWWERRSC